MQYRPYGKTGWEVSALGMGCMRLPRLEAKDGVADVDKEKAFELIRYAAEHGVNYFDTAFGYHHRTSEEVLGEALDGGLRKNVKIATKQPSNVMKDKDNMRRNLENTLTKLRTDYIDVYLIHNVNAWSWPEFQRLGAWEEYNKFKEEGMIRAIGFSYHGALPVFAEALVAYDWDMCQIQQNFLDTEREATEEAVRLAGEKGCALVIMEPLRGGNLARAPKRVQAVYDDFPEKRAPAEWAFRHLLNYPQVSSILSGVTTLEQLKENIAVFSRPDNCAGCMNDSEKALLARVKSAYESIENAIPCTGCEYCMPCPSGVGIPNVFHLYNEGVMFEYAEQTRRSYMFATNAKRDASNCTECRICEAKCPQGIKIADELKTAHAALKGWAE
ncbi:MAG: aldo/keto reductase [Defluviitaleaceae bacterium]|nr:aldo/keto reductase [Defluviitaleaceae bacterium]